MNIIFDENDVILDGGAPNPLTSENFLIEYLNPRKVALAKEMLKRKDDSISVGVLFRFEEGQNSIRHHF